MEWHKIFKITQLVVLRGCFKPLDLLLQLGAKYLPKSVDDELTIALEM
jgi:hypothetical protein